MVIRVVCFAIHPSEGEVDRMGFARSGLTDAGETGNGTSFLTGWEGGDGSFACALITFNG